MSGKKRPFDDATVKARKIPTRVTFRHFIQEKSNSESGICNLQYEILTALFMIPKRI